MQLNFLMVGHTHEDIDGLFGVLSSKLRNQNAFTTLDMNALFAEAGKSASQSKDRRSGLGIDNGYLPSDTDESRLWRCIADWRLFLQVTCNVVCCDVFCIASMHLLLLLTACSQVQNFVYDKISSTKYLFMCLPALCLMMIWTPHVCQQPVHRIGSIQVPMYVQGRMHEFFGLGTTHFTEVDEDTGAKEVIKLRVHSLLIKLHNGRACVYWKEFMRDETWLPEDGVGWPIFKEDVDLNLSTLQTMPTLPITGFAEVEKRIKVDFRSQSHTSCLSCTMRL